MKDTIWNVLMLVGSAILLIYVVAQGLELAMPAIISYIDSPYFY